LNNLNVNLGKHKVQNGEDDDFIDDEDGENMSLEMIMDVMMKKHMKMMNITFFFVVFQ